MTHIGPPLDRLMHRLADCPPDCLAEPRIGRTGTIHVEAVVNDLVLNLGGEPLDDAGLAPFQAGRRESRNRLRLVLVAAWLFHDDWFRQRGHLAHDVHRVLRSGLDDLAPLVAADLFVSDPDRREELVRRCLSLLDILPAGETEAQAEDRLRTLDSAERIRLIRDTREKQEQARALREAMRRKEAEEAAAKASRE